MIDELVRLSYVFGVVFVGVLIIRLAIIFSADPLFFRSFCEFWWLNGKVSFIAASAWTVIAFSIYMILKVLGSLC